jgi:hypothetical protein
MRYNRPRGDYIKLTVRWTPDQARILRHFSHALRISMSRIIDLLLRIIDHDKTDKYAARFGGNYHFHDTSIRGSQLGLEEIWTLHPHETLPP